jgi:hypothetical protein
LFCHSKPRANSIYWVSAGLSVFEAIYDSRTSFATRIGADATGPFGSGSGIFGIQNAREVERLIRQHLKT